MGSLELSLHIDFKVTLKSLVLLSVVWASSSYDVVGVISKLVVAIGEPTDDLIVTSKYFVATAWVHLVMVDGL